MAETQLPAVLPNHWTTPDGHAMAVRYADQSRHDLALGDASDFDLAHRCGMAGGRTMEDTVVLMAAKDRIRWLSAKLAQLAIVALRDA